MTGVQTCALPILVLPAPFSPTKAWISFSFTLKVTLRYEKGEPTEAVNAFNKLKDKKMTALIGDITSKPTLAVAPLAEEAKIPMITPTGTQFDITQGKNFVFRTCYTDPFQGNILAQFVKENLKLKTVAIMSNNSDD